MSKSGTQWLILPARPARNQLGTDPRAGGEREWGEDAVALAFGSLGLWVLGLNAGAERGAEERGDKVFLSLSLSLSPLCGFSQILGFNEANESAASFNSPNLKCPRHSGKSYATGGPSCALIS